MSQVIVLIDPLPDNTRLRDSVWSSHGIQHGHFGLNCGWRPAGTGRFHVGDIKVFVRFPYSTVTVIGAKDVYLYRGCLRVGYTYAPGQGKLTLYIVAPSAEY